MHKKFEIDQTNIKGGCQSERKFVIHNSKSNLPREFPLFMLISFRKTKKLKIFALALEPNVLGLFIYAHIISKVVFWKQINLKILGYYFSSQLTAILNLCLIYLKLLVHVL